MVGCNSRGWLSTFSQPVYFGLIFIGNIYPYTYRLSGNVLVTFGNLLLYACFTDGSSKKDNRVSALHDRKQDVPFNTPRSYSLAHAHHRSLSLKTQLPVSASN